MLNNKRKSEAFFKLGLFKVFQVLNIFLILFFYLDIIRFGLANTAHFKY